MMSFKTAFATTLALLFVSSSAHAGVFLEGGVTCLGAHSRSDRVPSRASERRSDAANTYPKVRIENVRLEFGSDHEAPDAAVVKFDIVNDDAVDLFDFVLELSIRQEAGPSDASASATKHLIAGPFTVQSDLVLAPGETADYQMEFTGLPAACHCAADIVVTARPVPQAAALPKP